MTKRNKVIFTIGTILIIGSIIMLVTTLIKANHYEERPRSVTIYYEEGKAPPVYGVSYENPNESELIAQACIASIGTDREIETIGYNMTYVMQVITAEAGADREMCLGCAQALFDTCVKYQAKYNPEEVCEKYQYTQPANWISDEARYACEQIFIYGNMYDATFIGR